MTTYTVKKISEYTNLDAVPEDTDELPINDATVTKAIPAGYLRRVDVRDIVASGAQTGASGSDVHLSLNHASAIAYSFTNAPTKGDRLTIYAATTAAHTVTLFAGVTWDGTNDVAELGTAADSLHAVALSATRFQIISNNGVTFS